MDYQAQPAKKENKAAGETSPKSRKDFIAGARKRLQTGIDAYGDNRKDQVDDVKFAAASPDNGWAWPERIRKSRQNDPNGARPVITINKLPQHIRLVTNEQRQNRPSIKVIPVDDKGDPEVAEILNGIVRHIEANSDADVAYDTACENQVTHGEGYFRILTDYCNDKSFDQDILIAPIKNSFSVYMDPDGLRRDSTGRYCEWAFITDRFHKDEFKREFPKAKETSWELVGTGDEAKGWVDGDYITIAEYFCFKDEKKTIYLWDDGSITDVLPEGAMAMAPIKTRETTIRRVMWTKMSPLEVLEEREWAGKYIPVIRVVGNEYEVEGKVVVSGLVRNSKDACRMLNYWTSQEAEILALAPKAPFMAAAEAISGHEAQYKTANTVNHAYLKYNAFNDDGLPIPAPSRVVPPIPPAGFINAKLGAADDIQSTVGQYNPSLGAEAKEKSGKAIQARQRQADVGTFHYMDNLARSIRHGGRVVLDLIPKIYDTKRVARIIGEDGEPDHVTLDPDQSEAKVEITDEQGAIQEIYNPTLGEYDVRVTVGPSYTTKRQEAAEFMAQVLNGNKELMQVMGDLYFKMLDVPGAEEISERLKKSMPPALTQDEKDKTQEQVIQTPHGPLPVSQAPQAIAGLMQQVEQMGQQLEQAGVADQQNKAKELEIQAFEAETRRMEVQSKDKERQFAATRDYVDRTVVDDTELLAPGGAKPAEAERVQ